MHYPARERNSCRAAGAKEASGRAPRCEARERWHSLGHRAEQARELRIEMTQLVGGQAFESVGQHAARRLRCAPVSLAQAPSARSGVGRLHGGLTDAALSQNRSVARRET
jgi:hypothetical protein